MTTNLMKHGWQFDTAHTFSTIPTALDTAVLLGGAAVSFGDGQPAYPFDVAFSPDGTRIVMADSDTNSIKLYSIVGRAVTHLRTFGLFGFDPGQFYTPYGVAWSPDGALVAVADRGNNRIQLLNYAGDFLSVHSVHTGFTTPSGVAFSPDGQSLLVVLDNSNSFSVYGLSGTALTLRFSAGTGGDLDGEFNGVGRATFGPGGSSIIATDFGNNRIQLFTISGNTATFQTKYGTLGDGPGQLDAPFGIAYNADGGYIAVTEYGNARVSVFSLSGNSIAFMSSYGSRGTTPDQFNYPRGIAVSPASTLMAIADTNNNRINVIDGNGGDMHHWTSYGSAFGTEYGVFKYPCGVAYNADGTMLAVADTNNSRVQVFVIDNTTATIMDAWNVGGPFDHVALSPDGTSLVATDTANNILALADIWTGTIRGTLTYGTFGDGDLGLNGPGCIAFSPDGAQLAVTDSGNNRVQVYGFIGATLTYQYTIGPTISGVPFDLMAPKGVAFSADGRFIAIADSGNNQIVVLELSGNDPLLKVVFGELGNANRMFNYPSAVAFDRSSTGRLIVADTGNHRVQIFDSPDVGCKFLFSYGQSGYSKGRLTAPLGVACDPISGRIAIADSSNDRVYLL